MLDAHADARFRDLELAYYTAWHSGLFSQGYAKGRFPKYEAGAPGRKRRGAGRMLRGDAFQMSVRCYAAALGGLKKKG